MTTKKFHVKLLNDYEGMFGGISSEEMDSVDVELSVLAYDKYVDALLNKNLPEVEVEHFYGPYGGTSIRITHLTDETDDQDEEYISTMISELT